MSHSPIQMTAALHEYFLNVSLREPKVASELRLHTMQLSEHSMLSSPEQAQFIGLLLQIMGARRVIEVGTFTGYSALLMALSLPQDGYLLCCDVSRQWTDIGRDYWRRAGVEHKIDLHIAPACETLQEQLDCGAAGSFDFAYIDADKVNYQNYYELCLQLVRAGGVIAIDNVLWNGAVIDEQQQSENTQAIRKFNLALHGDERIDLSVLPIGDGVSLARKRG